MELRHLRYALTLQSHAHFGRAAEALGIQQPPLSQQIKALETELGVKLFDRTSKGVHATAAGQVFLKRATEILGRLELATVEAADAHRGDSGSLAIGFVGTALAAVLPEALTTFAERYPRVNLDLREAPSADQIDQLLDGHLDAGFICGPVPGTARHHLTSVPLTSDHLVAAVPTDSPLAGSPLAVSSLEGHPLILVSRRTEPAAADAALAMCRTAGFEPHKTTEAGGLHTLLGLVACGLGVGIGPASMQRFRHVGVTLLELTPETPVLNIHLAHRTTNTEAVLGNFRRTVQAAHRPGTGRWAGGGGEVTLVCKSGKS
jgi:DNA-binding transcriptional LysR family regulator